MKTFVLVTGGSMRPLFKDKEPVAVEKTSFHDISIGDCVVYQWDGFSLLHRAWWKTRQHLIIKDDIGLRRFHRVAAGDITYKVIPKNIVAAGVLGFCYSVFMNGIFIAYRFVRKIT
jgi:signal peptidase I